MKKRFRSAVSILLCLTLCGLPLPALGAEQADWPGTYDAQRKQWEFETQSGDFWFSTYYLDSVCELPDNWYRNDMLKALKVGALSLLAEGRGEAFDTEVWPDRFGQTTASRQDTAWLICAVTEAQDLWPILTLDVPPDTQDESALRLYNFGIANGIDAQGSFGGDLPLTRGQAAALFARVLHPELRKRPPINPHTAGELSSILVSHGSFGFVDTEFLVDLNNGLLWSFAAEPWSGEKERDPKAENQGFQTSQSLDAQKIAQFREAPSLQSLLTWSGSYIGNALDGHHWNITLTFSNGETRQIVGSNAYPEEWDELYVELYVLTGENILEVFSDWINWPDESEEDLGDPEQPQTEGNGKP